MSVKEKTKEIKEETEKIQIQDFPGVSYTSLTTIYCRAMDYSSNDSIFKDKAAHDLYNRIECDWKPIKKGLYRHDFILISLRGRMFDILARNFLKKNPDGIIVSLGSGLDNRFARLDNGKCLFVDLDLPEVIKLKKKIYKTPERNTLLGQSVLDFSWIDTVYKLSQKASRKVFFIAEGLIPYLDREEIILLFDKIHERFKGSEIIFDVAGAKGLKLMAHHSGLKEWNATLRSGFNSGKEIESMHPGFQLIKEWYYPDEPDARRGIMMKLFWLVPMFRSLLFFIHGRFE